MNLLDVAMPLHGKRAIVTGAASGIGRATALAFAAAGATVVGLDLAAGDDPCPILACDVSDAGAVEAGVAAAVGQLGGLDILANIAGILKEGDLAEMSLADIDSVLNVNLRGTILVARAAIPHLSDASRIINISSELALCGRAGTSIYAATKAGVLGLTRCLAHELAPRTLVNAVAPGPTDTPLLAQEVASPSADALRALQPIARNGRPEEIAAVILFLAGPSATFVTGQCWAVDGGMTMA